jgi:monoamine oxidase
MYMAKQYDIIIIGSGMAGLYSAYNIQKIAPETTFLILEKHKRQCRFEFLQLLKVF